MTYPRNGARTYTATMVRGPLPGERLFAWPRSDSTRRLLRFAVWLGAVAWFFFPAVGGFLVSILPVLIAVALTFLGWIAGFILLGKVARALAPLPAVQPTGAAC